MAEFKDRIKELRLQNGYSMQEVVDGINKRFGAKLTSSHICRYENGDRTPTIKIVSYFVKFYGVTADYIIGLVDEPNAQYGPDYILKTSANTNVFIETNHGHRKVQAKTRKQEGNVG